MAVVQGRLRNVQKSVMHVQSCCFANQNLLLFSRSRCRRRRRRRHRTSLLKLPISVIQKFWLRDDTLLLSVEEGKINTLDTFTFQLLVYFSCRLHTLKEKRRRVTSMQ